VRKNRVNRQVILICAALYTEFSSRTLFGRLLLTTTALNMFQDS